MGFNEMIDKAVTHKLERDLISRTAEAINMVDFHNSSTGEQLAAFWTCPSALEMFLLHVTNEGTARDLFPAIVP